MNKYIIIDAPSDDNINLVVDFDTGQTKIFSSYKEAMQEIENCLNGYIINIDC